MKPAENVTYFHVRGYSPFSGETHRRPRLGSDLMQTHWGGDG